MWNVSQRIFVLLCAIIIFSFMATTAICDEDVNRYLIKVDGKWGFIDRMGNIAIEPVFDDAWAFKDGMAKILESDKEILQVR